MPCILRNVQIKKIKSFLKYKSVFICLSQLTIWHCSRLLLKYSWHTEQIYSDSYRWSVVVPWNYREDGAAKRSPFWLLTRQEQHSVNCAVRGWCTPSRSDTRSSHESLHAGQLCRQDTGTRAFQFGQKKCRLDSIRFSLPNRFFRFDSIQQSDEFAACTLIGLFK